MKVANNKFIRIKVKVKFAMLYLFTLIISLPSTAFASSTTKTQPGFVTSLINLANDFCTWAIAADLSIASLVCVYFAIRWKISSPDKKPAQIEAIKGTVFWAVVGAIIGTILKFILSYFVTTTV